MNIHLDLSAVEAFVLVADLSSFTHAAEALGITQAGVSAKLRRLEATLGRRLLNRTPRQVRLSADGDAFLPRARTLLAAQDLALTSHEVQRRSLSLGISDHVAGPELPIILSKVNSFDPGLTIQIRVGASADLAREFERGDLDVAIIRHKARRRGDETLFHDKYSWFGPISGGLPRSPLRLITVDEACGVRAIAVRLLNNAKIAYDDAFIGGGMATACAAVAAGLGIAPLPIRLAPVGVIDVAEQYGLPALPRAEMSMLAHSLDGQTKSTLRVLIAAFRGRTDLD